jgi:hypothetical protein
VLIETPAQRAMRSQGFCVYDFSFRLTSNVSEAKPLLAALYCNFPAGRLHEPVTEAAIDRENEGWFSWRVGEKGGLTSTLAGALWNLEATLCENIIRSQRRRIAIHAATIQLANSAAMLSGCSQSGKTTLSLALARRGFPVWGDDVALVDPETFDILPIPRCFHLDDPSVALLEADGLLMPGGWPSYRFIVPSDFAALGQPPARARCLIFMRGPRGEHATIAPLSQAEMTARMLSETGQGPLSDSETVAVICRLASGASCFTLTPGPLGETADAVAAVLADARRSEG